MGSYTTTGLAQRLATAHHVVIPQGGVYGSAVPVPALGLHASVQAARFSAHLSGQVDSWIHNQSVPGLIVRATRDQTTARWVSRGLVVAFAALLIARPRRNIRLTFALAVAAMLLSQPISWEFYFPLTIVMVMALAEEGAPRA